MPGGTMVADSAGHVWVRSAWSVTRIDVPNGKAMTWDAADDAAFASPHPEPGRSVSVRLLAAGWRPGPALRRESILRRAPAPCGALPLRPGRNSLGARRSGRPVARGTPVRPEVGGPYRRRESESQRHGGTGPCADGSGRGLNLVRLLLEFPQHLGEVRPVRIGLQDLVGMQVFRVLIEMPYHVVGLLGVVLHLLEEDALVRVGRRRVLLGYGLAQCPRLNRKPGDGVCGLFVRRSIADTCGGCLRTLPRLRRPTSTASRWGWADPLPAQQVRWRRWAQLASANAASAQRSGSNLQRHQRPDTRPRSRFQRAAPGGVGSVDASEVLRSGSPETLCAGRAVNPQVARSSPHLDGEPPSRPPLSHRSQTRATGGPAAGPGPRPTRRCRRRTGGPRWAFPPRGYQACKRHSRRCLARPDVATGGDVSQVPVAFMPDSRALQASRCSTASGTILLCPR